MGMQHVSGSEVLSEAYLYLGGRGGQDSYQMDPDAFPVLGS